MGRGGVRSDSAVEALDATMTGIENHAYYWNLRGTGGLKDGADGA